jgi:hypothetical protein
LNSPSLPPQGPATAAPQLPPVLPPIATPVPPPKPVTHDVTIVTTKKLAQARVLGVPPEEFGIERGARYIADCNYCFHDVVTKTRAQLIVEGIRNQGPGRYRDRQGQGRTQHQAGADRCPCQGDRGRVQGAPRRSAAPRELTETALGIAATAQAHDAKMATLKAAHEGQTE